MLITNDFEFEQIVNIDCNWHMINDIISKGVDKENAEKLIYLVDDIIQRKKELGYRYGIQDEILESYKIIAKEKLSL